MRAEHAIGGRAPHVISPVALAS